MSDEKKSGNAAAAVDVAEPSSTYRMLHEASPPERASIIAGLIAADPEGRLILPGEEGAQTALNETDLRAALAAMPEGEQRSLRRAVLRGASLRQVNLEGVDLSESDLAGAHLVRANLRSAKLESVNFEGCDLANVDVSGATLAEANLKKAMFEDAKLEGATLRFADARGAFFENANLQNADLLSADFRDAELSGATLKNAVLEEANFAGANLSNVSFEGANLSNTNFRGAELTGASLIGATVHGASFREASLKEARLMGLDLSRCDLTHAKFARAWLDRTQMDHEQLGGAIGEERARDFGDAKRGYQVLENNFLQLGDQSAARWAYGKRRRMQKLESLANARVARSEHKYRSATEHYGAFASDQIVEWLCDYGESVARVFGFLVFLYVGFAVLYGVTGSVLRIHGNGVAPTTTRHPVDLAIFSLLAMTTSGSPGVGLQPRDQYVYFLSGIQALLGISFTGLLGFVIGNRIRR